MLWRVYVDEAGDRGLSQGSSKYFVVSGVIVEDPVDVQLRALLGRLKQDLGRLPTDVLHYRKLTHAQKVKATQDIGAWPITISSAIVCKEPIGQPLPGGIVAHIANPDPMYLYALRLLLERILWFVRDSGGGACVVTFAHVKRFKVAKLHSYRQALENSQTSIGWAAFTGHRFRVSDPASTMLLQVADTTASALFAAVEPDTYANTEPRYVGNLAAAIYRRPPGAVTSYGLKVFPTSQCAPGGPLHWLCNV